MSQYVKLIGVVFDINELMQSYWNLDPLLQ